MTRGYTIAEAAQSAGMQGRSLAIALRKPHVRARWEHVKQAWRDSESSHAFVVMAKLARNAASEDVQFKSAKFLIELDEAANNRMPAEARQVVNIITNSVNLGGERSGLVQRAGSGVIEAEPWSPPQRIVEAVDEET